MSESAETAQAQEAEWLWRLTQFQDNLERLIPRDDIFIAFAFQELTQAKENATDPFDDWPMGQLLTYCHGPAVGLTEDGALRGLRIDSGAGTHGYWAEEMSISVENIEQKQAEHVDVEASCFYYMKCSWRVDKSEGFELEKGMHQAWTVLSGLFDAMPSRLRETWGITPPLSHLADILLWLAVDKAHPLLKAFALRGWRSLGETPFMPEALFFHLEPDLKTATDYVISTLRDVAQIYAHPMKDDSDDADGSGRCQRDGNQWSNPNASPEAAWSVPMSKTEAAEYLKCEVKYIDYCISHYPSAWDRASRQKWLFDKNVSVFSRLP